MAKPAIKIINVYSSDWAQAVHHVFQNLSISLMIRDERCYCWLDNLCNVQQTQADFFQVLQSHPLSWGKILLSPVTSVRTDEHHHNSSIFLSC